MDSATILSDIFALDPKVRRRVLGGLHMELLSLWVANHRNINRLSTQQLLAMEMLEKRADTLLQAFAPTTD